MFRFDIVGPRRQPAEFHAVRKTIAWRPYTFHVMDFRPDNLTFRART